MVEGLERLLVEQEDLGSILALPGYYSLLGCKVVNKTLIRLTYVGQRTYH